MKRKHSFVISCLFLFLFSSVAFASDEVNTQRAYIAGRLGVGFLNNSTIEVLPYTIDSEFDTGVFIEGAVGRDFGMFRLEIEVVLLNFRLHTDFFQLYLFLLLL